MRRDLETTQFVCRDKNILPTIFVVKNFQEPRDRQTEAKVLRLISATTKQYTSK